MYFDHSSKNCYHFPSKNSIIDSKQDRIMYFPEAPKLYPDDELTSSHDRASQSYQEFKQS